MFDPLLYKMITKQYKITNRRIMAHMHEKYNVKVTDATMSNLVRFMTTGSPSDEFVLEVIEKSLNEIINEILGRENSKDAENSNKAK